MNRRVPPALEAVCLKALAFRPADRYATAAELADDVERWLAGEPVTAYAEPWVAKARRWMRRHRSLVTRAAAALVVLALSLAFGAALLGATNAELRQRAIDLTNEQARTREALHAEAQRRKEARDALDAQTSLVMEDLLGRQQTLTDDHKRFLRQALKAYEQFAADTGQAEQSRAGVARAAYRVGQIRQRMGATAEATTAYRQAVTLFERLIDDFPATPAYRRNLATTNRFLGALLHLRGDQAGARAAYEAARTAYEQAVVALEPQTRDFPKVPEHRQDLANSHNGLGIVLFELKEWAAARAAYERAVAVHGPLAADFPDVPAYRQELANSHFNLGLLLWRQGDRKAARAAYEQAQALRERLAKDFPDVPAYRHDLVAAYNNLAIVLQELGDRPAARAVYEQALPLRKRLVQDFPAVPGYRGSLAGSHNNLGNLLMELEDWKAARAAHEEALTLRQQLAREFPAVPGYRRDVAISYNSLGNTLRDWANGRRRGRLIYKPSPSASS